MTSPYRVQAAVDFLSRSSQWAWVSAGYACLFCMCPYADSAVYVLVASGNINLIIAVGDSRQGFTEHGQLQVKRDRLVVEVPLYLRAPSCCRLNLWCRIHCAHTEQVSMSKPATASTTDKLRALGKLLVEAHSSDFGLVKVHKYVLWNCLYQHRPCWV